MSDYCEGNSTVHMESCLCHQSLNDVREFITIVCYYNCKICDFSCTSVADIRSHVVESHFRRTSATEGAVFHNESKANENAVSDGTQVIQMSSSGLALTATTSTSEEAPASTVVGLMSKEFSTISQSGCDLLSSTDPLALQQLHSTTAGETFQLFVNNQEVQLNVSNCFSGDSLQEVAALPASVEAGLCVESSRGSSSVQSVSVDVIKAAGPSAVLSGAGAHQTVENNDQVTEMYVCGTCGTVFNSVGIVEHMLQVHGIHLDSVNETGPATVLSVSDDQPMPSVCAKSMEITVPPNTMSIGTQAQLSKKPGRKRKTVTDVPTSAAAVEQNSKRVASIAEKDNAAAVAVKTLGIERITTAENGPSKRRIQPPRALVEDYHIHRLRQSKPRTRSAASAAPELLCSFAGCRAAFRQQEAVEYHVKCHTLDGVFCCPECQSSFIDWSSMLPHLWTVHGVDLYAYQCGRCKFRANQSVTVTEHAVAEHGNHKPVQPFLCSVCGQTFRKANLRKQHEKSHNNHRLFSHRRPRSEIVAFRRCICDMCKRSFANKKSLNKHIEVIIIFACCLSLPNFMTFYEILL